MPRSDAPGGPGAAWQDTPEGIAWAMENHAPEDAEVGKLLDRLTEAYVALGQYVQSNVPRSAERALALNDLRASLRGVKAAVTCHQGQLEI